MIAYSLKYLMRLKSDAFKLTLDGRLPLRANFSWTFVGNVVYAGSQWGILAVLAKLGSPKMVGQFALGLALTAPVIMFANLQLRGVQATDSKQEYQFSDYFGLRIITTTLALLIIGIMSIAMGYELETVFVILAIGVAKAIETISDVFYGLFQQKERMDYIAKSMMLRGMLLFPIMGFAIYWTHNILWGILGMISVFLGVLIGFDFRNGRIATSNNTKTRNLIYPKWKSSTLVKLAWLTLPLGFVMFLISSNASIPRFFIQQYLGEYKLGIFAAIISFQRVGGIVVGALGQSTMPRLARYYAVNNQKAYIVLLFKLLGIGLLLGVGGIIVSLLAGRQILTLVYTPEYARQDVLVLVMILSIFVSEGSFLGYAITAARYFKIQIPLFAITVIVTIVGCILLLPTYGLIGAIVALIVSASVQIVGSLFIIKYVLHTKPTKSNILFYGGSGINGRE